MQESAFSDTSVWKAWMSEEKPESFTTLPARPDSLGSIQKIFVLSKFRPDRVPALLKSYSQGSNFRSMHDDIIVRTRCICIADALGEECIDVSRSTIGVAFDESTCCTPILLFCSPKSHPLPDVARLAEEKVKKK